MITEYITKNIITDWHKNVMPSFLIHGCNWQKVMGAGIAKEIKQRFYGAYEIDLHNKNGIGDYSVYMHTSTHFIFNAYTQIHWRNNFVENDTINDRYGYIKSSLTAIYNEWKPAGHNIGIYNPIDVYIPLLGAGLAGGDWKVIRKLIYSIFNDNAFNVHIGYWDREWTDKKLNKFLIDNRI